MNILDNTLTVGAEKPFTFLLISDVHLSETDREDSPRRREFAAKRKGYFSYAPSAVEQVKDLVKKTALPLVNTGDMLDFITPENLRLAKEFIEETRMLFITGNHEYWHCPNDRFHLDDVYETYEVKNQSLDQVSQALGCDVRFFCTEINGVKLVGVDDSDYCIDEEIFARLKEVEEEGKPILLFMHIPLYSPHLEECQKGSLNAPPQFFENAHPVDAWERSPDELTRQICDHIRSSPLIKCVFSGHVHRNVEILGLDGQDQIVTGIDTVRRITVC